MNDIIADIEVLENLVIAMNEGASDEKYAALYAVVRLILQKKDMLRKYEDDVKRLFDVCVKEGSVA